MEYSDEMVTIALKKQFGEKNVQALKILERYGQSKERLEKNRVWLAVIKLSNGKMEAVEKYIQMALSDFRDVLLQAEYKKIGSKAFEYKQLEAPYKELLGK